MESEERRQKEAADEAVAAEEDAKAAAEQQRLLARVDTDSSSEADAHMSKFSPYGIDRQAFNGDGGRQQVDDDDELPDLGDAGVQDAAVKIQSVYRGFQARKKVQVGNTFNAI